MAGERGVAGLPLRSRSGRWATGKCVETYNGVSRGLVMKHSPNISGVAASPEIARAKMPPSVVEESPPAGVVAYLVIASLSSGVSY